MIIMKILLIYYKLEKHQRLYGLQNYLPGTQWDPKDIRCGLQGTKKKKKRKKYGKQIRISLDL